jgi:hypothetical protein
MDGYMFVHLYSLHNVNTAAMMSTAFTLSTGIAQLHMIDGFGIPLSSVAVNFASSVLNLELCVSTLPDAHKHVLSAEKDVTTIQTYLPAPEQRRHMLVCQTYADTGNITKELYPAIKNMINIKPHVRMESKALYDNIVKLIEDCMKKTPIK